MLFLHKKVDKHRKMSYISIINTNARTLVMKKLNTIIAASLLAVTAGVASAGCVFETNTPGEMFLYPGIKTSHGTGIWKTTQGATVSLKTRNVNQIYLTQARKNKAGFNKQQPTYGQVWREGNYADTEFAYDAKYDYRTSDVIYQ